ncbi:MAG: putative manganese-dependent inorganic diphosphatase [Verrucomicrobiaceae bacterium]|nr:MAG: putative manganese-dependent inorganic diphosphatase [Verrucomicrobiaceae bacterium]
MLPFYVIGHRNPDTDAICSAIGHAALLRASGEVPNAIAARCGDLPQRTRWVLDKAGIEPPVLLNDVRVSAGMLCRRDIVQVEESDTFLTAYRRLLFYGVRSAPVVDTSGKLRGMLRYLDLLGLLLPPETDGMKVRTVHVSFSKVVDTLQATSVGADLPPAESEEELILLVGASSQNTVDKRLKTAKQEGLVNRYLVICGDRPIVQRYAIDHGARGLLVTGGNTVTQDIADYAKKKGVVVLLCHQDTASASTLLRCSRTVKHVMTSNIVTIGSNEPVSRLRKRLTALDQDLFPVMEQGSGKMVGVLSKSDLVDPPRIRLALVDHNEYAQAVAGVEEAEITEVIDHHRLAGNLVSREPIRYLNEPVGSTSTLVARKFLHRDLTPDAGVAMCLCAGIVSDTLCLTSPTTTLLDREMLNWLCKIADIEPEEFTEEFFAVGSLLATGTSEEILNADRKEFTEDGMTVSISQVEERDLHGFGPRREELECVLKELVRSKDYAFGVLAITDVARHHSVILAVGQEQILSQFPFKRVDNHLFEAPGVVSRKKQIFPAVSEAIQNSR